MAALVLGVTGALTGGPLAGLAGVIAGKYLDRTYLGPLFGPRSTVNNVGPRLDSLSVMSSAEGTASAPLLSAGRLIVTAAP